MNDHIDHVVVDGEPGSGKSLASARDVQDHPGPAIVEDPQERSLGRAVMEGTDEADLLVDRLTEREGLPYGLLAQSKSTDPSTRREENLKRATLFTEVMTADGSGSMVGTPLKEEHTLNTIQCFLEQDPPKDPGKLNPIYALYPGTDEYRILVRDCRDEVLRHKIGRLAKLNERALRNEAGSADRALSRTFRDPRFLNRCREGDLTPFYRNPRGRLCIEGGSAPKTLKQLVFKGVNLGTVDYAKLRPVPWPPILVVIDECKDVGVGDFEELQAATTRKFGLFWRLLWQFVPAERKGLFQVCQRKETFRSGYEFARQMAPYYLGWLAGGEESRAAKLDAIVTEITGSGPGWRFIADRHGVRREYVPMLDAPWPEWPVAGGGTLRDAKLEEKLCRIRQRPEYRSDAPSPRPSATATPPPSSSPDDSSPAARLRRRGKRPAGPSSSSDGEGSSD